MRSNFDCSDLSICIPTKGRQDALSTCLCSLAIQGISNFELNIVSGNEASLSFDPNLDRTLKLLENFGSVNIFQKPDLNLQQTRQFLLKKSRRYCLFVDDDVILRSGIIRGMFELYGYITRFSHFVFASPIISEPLNLRNRPEWFSSRLPQYPALTPYGTYPNGRKVPLLLTDTTCCLMRTSVCLNAGGFNPVDLTKYSTNPLIRVTPLEHLNLTVNLIEHDLCGMLLPALTTWHVPSARLYNHRFEHIVEVQTEVLDSLKTRFTNLVVSRGLLDL